MLRKKNPFEDFDLDSLTSEINGEGQDVKKKVEKKGPVKNKGSCTENDAIGFEFEIFEKTIRVTRKKKFLRFREWCFEIYLRIWRRADE